MTLFVLEAKRKGSNEEGYEVLGVFSSEEVAYKAVDLIREKDEWCDFSISFFSLDDASDHI